MDLSRLTYLSLLSEMMVEDVEDRDEVISRLFHPLSDNVVYLVGLYNCPTGIGLIVWEYTDGRYIRSYKLDKSLLPPCFEAAWFEALRVEPISSFGRYRILQTHLYIAFPTPTKSHPYHQRQDASFIRRQLRDR